ncbi:MAG: DUF4998 domain-containing protein [Rikenellaceae bacterium]
MKRFFRTSAILACFALFSVACDRAVEEDTTVYEGLPIVPASSINELFPGNGKFYVEWEVSDDDNITSTILAWDDSNGNSGSYTVEEVSAREIKDLTIDNLPAGTYSVSLTNSCDIDVYTIPVSRSVTVFNDDTYASSTALGYTQILHDGSNATIYWEEAQEDCVGVIITYKRAGSTYVSDLLSVYTGVTVLSGADESQEISYNTCYQPDIAIEGDYVIKSSTGVPIPAPSPTAPTGVSVRPGNEKMEVTWSVDTGNIYFAKTVIEYGYSGGTIKTVTYTADELDNGENVKYIEDLVAEKIYSIEIYNCGEDDGAVSASQTVNYIEIYDLESLQASYTSSMPTVTPYMENSILYITVTQSTTVGSTDCDIVSFNYQRTSSDGDVSKRGVAQITDFTEPYAITGVVEGSKYTYSATFSLPDGALDDETTIEKHGTYEETYSSWYTLPANIDLTE